MSPGRYERTMVAQIPATCSSASSSIDPADVGVDPALRAAPVALVDADEPDAGSDDEQPAPAVVKMSVSASVRPVQT